MATTANVAAVVLGWAYVLGLIVAVVSMASRLFRYWRAGLDTPALLPRDFILIAGSSLTLGLMVYARQHGIRVTNDLAWTLATYGVATFVVWVFVYFELFVIERPRH